MNSRSRVDKQPIVCLLWRPVGAVIRDGGFRRTYAILESLQADVPLTLIDRYPSLLRKGHSFRVIEYRIPGWVDFLKSRIPVLGGLLEALVTFSLLVIHGAYELNRAGRSIVYVPTSEIPWVTFAAAALAAAFRSRLVLANLNTRIGLTNIGGGVVGRLLWKIHARADRVIALSSAIATELRSVDVIGNVSVNSCGFDRPDFPTSNREPPKHGGIYVGRVEAAKGVDDLLDVWRLVSRDFPHADLRIVGHASSQNRAKFTERCGKLGLHRLVQMLGVVPDATKWELLDQSRVCIFLSHVEGWGFVPLEALSLGLPVIVYDLPCYRESLRGLEGVYPVDIGDTAAAAAQAAQLLAMPDHEYLAMSEMIASSFRYPDWSQIASNELALITGSDLGV